MAKLQRNSDKRATEMLVRRENQHNFIYNNYKPYVNKGKYTPKEEEKRHAETAALFD